MASGRVSNIMKRHLVRTAGGLLTALFLALGVAAFAARVASPDVYIPLPLALLFVGLAFVFSMTAVLVSSWMVLTPVEELQDVAGVTSDPPNWLPLRNAVERLVAHESLLAEQQQSLASHNQELSRALELQGQSLANVSHELRTPLTSIVGYCAMLRDELTGHITPEQGENLETIARNATVLLSLINNFLDFSRIKAGKLEMTWTPVLVAECIESAFDMVEPQLRAKGLTFDIDLPDQPLVIQGSFDRLRQVFVNLLSNAVKFTDSGSVGVQAREVNRKIEIVVWDTGIGIDPAQLPHVFDEFRQADSSIRRRYGGSGLGLAICRSIVVLHNGTIEAENRPDGGTRMVLRLPAVQQLRALVGGDVTPAKS